MLALTTPIQSCAAMAMQRPIFVAATKQHVGKTTTSLALTSGLAKRFGKVGFMKPVGQQHVLVQTSLTEQTIRVDKDVRLMREHFKLHHIDYQYMSPVLIPRGYTRDYIDGKIGDAQQERAIRCWAARGWRPDMGGCGCTRPAHCVPPPPPAPSARGGGGVPAISGGFGPCRLARTGPDATYLPTYPPCKSNR